jgi:hypothetical protein
MTQTTALEKQILRKQPQSTKLYLSIFQPTAVFKARVNDVTITKGARIITYNNVSLGVVGQIRADMTMWVGLTPGGMELGKVRVRSAVGSQITVSENSNVDWRDNAYLTVFEYWELWPIFPRIISDPSNPENTLWYKDYDIAYTNQNSTLGTYVNAGPHRALNLDPASNLGRVYYTTTGTYNLLGDSLNYNWFFEGATITGSSSAVPGYITYNTPGHYVTRLSVSGSSGEIDTTYRYVSVYNDANPSIAKWQMESFQGSREEGGYTVSLKVFQIIPIQEHAVVVIYADSIYGDTQINLGGNAENNSNIFFAGYVDKDSIQYDYQHSEVSFDVVSITELMKKSSGFSVSVGSKASPAFWYELLDMDSRRALYHYLRWHTTALNIADFQFIGQDYPIQFFDSDRGSMFDAIDNYMKNTLIGDVVSDRQGKLWAEVDAMAYPNPTGSFSSPVMNITNRDWINTPRVDERLTSDVSYLEYGGVAYSGVVTGTFDAYIGSAPGDAPGYWGEVDSHEGLALGSQDQLNTMLGNIYANKNSQFPSIVTDFGINATNLDIAPQESVGLHLAQDDTVRNEAIDILSIPNSMTWRYDPEGFKLLPQIEFKQLTNGIAGQTVVITPQTDIGGGYSIPPLEFPPTPLDFPPVVFDGPLSGDGSPARVLIHDTVAGFIYTNTFNKENGLEVGWFQGNGGLTTTQYQSATKCVVCPNGAIYIACMFHPTAGNTYIARSPGIGQPFTVLYDRAGLATLVGIPLVDGICAMAVNPSKAEEIGFAVVFGGTNVYTFIGKAGAFVAGAFSSLNAGADFACMSYSSQGWLLTATNQYQLFSTNMQSTIRTGSTSSSTSHLTQHTRGGILNSVILWNDGAGDDKLALSPDNCATMVNDVSSIGLKTNMWTLDDGLICDPTGIFMMASRGNDSPIKSSDGGYSWSQMLFLAPLVLHFFANCGDSSRWIAVAGSQSPYYSKDFGVNWSTKTGNLSQIVALPNLNIVKVIP